MSDGTYSDCTITVTDSDGKVSNTLTITSFTVDTIAPVISEVTVVATPTSDTTPDYTFSSDEAGTITYGGSCSSSTITATSGNNTITLVALSDGTYSDCTITVTDSDGKVSNTLTITSFTVDTTAPVISEVTVVTTPTSDTTPDYTFSSDESGTITYEGSCSSSTTSATSGNNTITLVVLSDGTYSDCTIKVTDSSGNASNSLTITSFTVSTVSEITQTLGNDGYQTGSFVVPYDGISFLLSTFLDNNSAVGFYSLTDPDGTNILSSSSALYNKVSGSTGRYGHANVLVPQSPNFSAKAGTWTFKNYGNDRVKLVMRSDSTPSNTIIVVQPYITGTTWSSSDISEALNVMSLIYAKNGITLDIKNTITISDNQYASVSLTFTDSTTSALVSQGSTDAVNLFFVEDQLSGSYLGVAAGIPGSMKITNSWNGVLNFLTPHASGSTLNSQLLGETAAHEMGHQLGLFHVSESGGTRFDILSDTPECAISRDTNSSGTISAEECDGYGAENLMFWTAWSSSSQAAGKKNDTLSSYQQNVLKYSPMANTDTNPDTTSPTVASISPSNGTSSVSLTSSISVIFSEPMDAASITTNSSGTSCSGTIQLSSDSFSTCVQMSSSPSESNSYKTFSVSPTSSLSSSTNYKLRVTTGVKDFSGNNLSIQYETSSGFTTALSYVNAWVKSSDSRIALDWKSDSFIYMCLVSDYTYAAHGSYSSSNSRLTWWDGTYNTVTKSGSNIILDSANYVPATLTSACNPFWINSTSENSYYTNAARSIGYWGFTYTISSTSYTDYLYMSTISSSRASDNNYYTYGLDSSGNIIIGTYSTSSGVWLIIDTSDSNYYQNYVFAMNSSNSGITSGDYYLYDVSTSSFSSAISMTGAKIYGTPRTYRTLNEKSEYEIMKQKHQEMLDVESRQRNSVLSDKDLQAFKRFKKILQTFNSTDKEPIKTYLRSFRTK